MWLPQTLYSVCLFFFFPQPLFPNCMSPTPNGFQALALLKIHPVPQKFIQFLSSLILGLLGCCSFCLEHCSLLSFLCGSVYPSGLSLNLVPYPPTQGQSLVRPLPSALRTSYTEFQLSEPPLTYQVPKAHENRGPGLSVSSLHPSTQCSERIK